MSSTDSSGSVIPLWSETVRGCAIDAWVEVRPIAESLPKPKRSTIARFFPTDACEAPINAAITEYPDKVQSHKAGAGLPQRITNYKRGGLVLFPGKTVVGQTFTIMIPLHIVGEVKVEGSILDVDHYYHIHAECDIEVPDTAKLIVLVISDFK